MVVVQQLKMNILSLIYNKVGSFVETNKSFLFRSIDENSSRAYFWENILSNFSKIGSGVK